jgi:hypothetical protein
MRGVQGDRGGAERRDRRANELLRRRQRPRRPLRIAHADERLARPHAHARAPDVHGDLVQPWRRSFERKRILCRLIADHVVVAHVVADPAEASCEIVRVHHGEAAGLFGQIREALLGIAAGALAICREAAHHPSHGIWTL